ncbi:MAG: CRISPR-associated endonuclease Cas2 [Crocosphaera sp.]
MQFSVFECLLNVVQFAKLQLKLESLIKPIKHKIKH